MVTDAVYVGANFCMAAYNRQCGCCNAVSTFIVLIFYGCLPSWFYGSLAGMATNIYNNIWNAVLWTSCGKLSHTHLNGMLVGLLCW